MKIISFFILITCILISGCNTSRNSSEKDAYLGGEIINPTSEYVIITKDNTHIDTLFLKSNNQFGQRIKIEQEGIYTFKHPPENQIVYLKPGDSTLIHINTFDFDESINFSGSGSIESNFLSKMFLLNEKNNDLILSYYKIHPAEFAKITDSIRAQRNADLKALKKKHKFSMEFSEIAQASVDYEFYDLRERYTFLIKKYYREFANKIPDNFQDYRKKIDFNKENFQSYYVYMNLIDDYLRTRAIEHCDSKGKEKTRDCYNLNNFQNIKYRMLLIDSLTQVQNIKNEFLDRLGSQAITIAESKEEINETMEILREINYSNIEAIKKIAFIQESYLVGNSLDDKTLKNTDEKNITYSQITNDTPSITYTWSIYSPVHYKWQQRLIKDLRQKYPDINFIGINIDEGEVDEWLKVIDENNYDSSHEYQISNRNIDKETFQKYLYKNLFIDSSGKIVKGDAQLNTPTFENEILEFLNE